jgi:predicted NAD/FAD-dependent oxidoreductase
MSPRQIVIVRVGPAGLATARVYREHGRQLIVAGESPL